jgi:hypothetical protein
VKGRYGVLDGVRPCACPFVGLWGSGGGECVCVFVCGGATERRIWPSVGTRSVARVCVRQSGSR